MAAPRTTPRARAAPTPQAAECCPFCGDDGISFCRYHACTTPEQLANELVKHLSSTNQGQALEQYFSALLAGVTTVPRETLELIAKQRIEPMVTRLDKSVYGEKTSFDFRKLAGLCLAIAVVLEAQEALDP